MKSKLLLLGIVVLLMSTINVYSQEEEKKSENTYEFKMLKSIKTTPVKNQSRTGTCWSFAMTSFFEAEAIRKGKGEHILSPMFTVYNTYRYKANRFLRLQRYVVANFPDGGALNDVPDMFKIYGMVPYDVYSGLEYGSEKHNHSEFSRVLNGYLKSISSKRSWDKRSKSYKEKKYVSPMWEKGFKSLLNTWLGTPPETFEYQGKTYTPESFAKMLDVNPDDYILLTSFNHFPFYSEFVLEVPDNWSQAKAMNVPLEEFRAIIKNSIEKGYSIGWASDMGDSFTGRQDDIWTFPKEDVSKMKKEEKKEFLKNPAAQRVVTQDFWQKGYDTFITTDDHAMHIVGMAEDQLGNLFYYVKNSWGTDRKLEGYEYVSESFVLYKTLSIYVHKDVIPKSIRKKINR